MQTSLLHSILDRIEILENQVKTLEQAHEISKTTGEEINALTTWTAQEVAKFLHVTRDHLYRKLSKEKYFPKPIANSGRLRRYF